MRLEFERVPELRRKPCHIGKPKHRRVGGIEGIVQRFLERGEIGENRMVAVRGGGFQEIRQPLREPAQVRMMRWLRRDIGVSHRVEHLVAEIAVKQLVIVAHGIDQPRTVGVLVDPEQHFALFFRAVENFGQNRFVAAQDAALEIALQPGEFAHLACRTCGNIVAAISRARLTSATSSSSGGMLSSRSIMVETRPNRFSAAA